MIRVELSSDHTLAAVAAEIALQEQTAIVHIRYPWNRWIVYVAGVRVEEFRTEAEAECMLCLDLRCPTCKAPCVQQIS